ncbi:hypothetical protein D3C75_1335590 [compost metagenome]
MLRGLYTFAHYVLHQYRADDHPHKYIVQVQSQFALPPDTLAQDLVWSERHLQDRPEQRNVV